MLQVLDGVELDAAVAQDLVSAARLPSARVMVDYDACHAFSVTVDGQSVLNFGDLSVLSFHGTKVYTTFEGGAIVCRDESTKRRIDFLKNFGFAGETTVVAPGINAKMNEFQAALGLLQLKYVDQAIGKRRRVALHYRDRLAGVAGITYLDDIPGVRHCYPYFPVLVDEKGSGRSRDELYEELKTHNIFCRRYFYPLISQFPAYRGLESAEPGKMANAEYVTERVLCLPIYPDLQPDQLDEVASLLQPR